MESFKSEVYKMVSKIPRGKVMTYGSVACAVGKPRAARAVGQVLHRNTDPVNIPCHRVVYNNGSLSKSYAFGGEAVKRKKLLEEGVVFVGDKVDLTVCLFGSPIC